MSKTKEGSNGPVTVYINRLSLDGERFQNGTINGVIVKEFYPRGVAGGISDSVERLETLNPLRHEVVRLHVASPSAFEKLVDWYSGKSSFLSATEGGTKTMPEPKTGPGANRAKPNPDDQQEGDENSTASANQYDADDKRNDTEERLVSEVASASTQIAAEYANKPGDDVDAIVKRRIGQGPFRNLLVKKYGVSCCVSGLANKRLLIASHIVPWSKASPTQKTDPENGLLLSVSWDALFDKGFVSFDDDGKLLCSEMLEEDTAQHLGVSMTARLPVDMLTEERRKNLFWHRKNHGFKT